MPKGIKTPSGDVVHLKTSFEAGERLEPFYTGGDVILSSDGRVLYTSCDSFVKAVNVETGQTTLSITEEEDSVASVALSIDQSLLSVGWRSVLVKLYEINEEGSKCVRSWKAHNGPTVTMAFDATSSLLASGSTDSSIKVWDCRGYYCTHNLRGSSGVVSMVQFHPSRLQLLSTSADNSIRVWDLQSSKCVQVLRGHVSTVTAIELSLGGDLLISGGRDQVVLVWDLASGTITHTHPVYEAVEGLVVVPMDTLDGFVKSKKKKRSLSEGVAFATAGDKGVIRLWNSLTSDPIATLPALSQSYSGLLYSGGLLVGVTFDHSLIIYNSTQHFNTTKQLLGNLDEVLDVCYIGRDYLSVATNSEEVKLLHRPTGHCQSLSGHTGIILSIDANGHSLVTASRDNTIRLWKLCSGTLHCVAVGTGHTHYVGAVALSRVKGSFIVSGSQDCTVKLWSLKGLQEGEEPSKLSVKYTQLAHDKDINAVDVAPNDKVFVTGSQDRTLKLWSVKDGALLGTFKGHRRGVWSVKFSPVDQCVASASGDGTVRLWALSSFSCVKTFEGHTNSVLKVAFLSRGMQLASSGSDGLVKVWTIRTNECAATMDGHTERVWALAVGEDGGEVVSGGGDSLVCTWKDVSESVEKAEIEKQEELLLRQQELDNLLLAKDYVRAVGVALSLDQPYRLLALLQELLEEGRAAGSKFTGTILSLRQDQQASLVRYSSRWNQNAKHCHVAQSVLAVLLGNLSQEVLLSLEDVGDHIKGFIPYTERHLQRLDRLEELSMFVEYSCQKMSLVANEKTVELSSKPVDNEVETVELIMAPADSTTPVVGIDDSTGNGIHDNDDAMVTSTHTDKNISRKKTKLKRLIKASRKRTSI
ncbi:transducin beta-like protein 3 isoform X2 [Halichondria panicea]|uniref:transducin beta-like protein 3 isoform X2 n=1 Tax=Halichondria panicea TaxID=6063 RepID=UPI00312B8938